MLKKYKVLGLLSLAGLVFYGELLGSEKQDAPAVEGSIEELNQSLKLLLKNMGLDENYSVEFFAGNVANEVHVSVIVNGSGPTMLGGGVTDGAINVAAGYDLKAFHDSLPVMNYSKYVQQHAGHQSSQAWKVPPGGVCPALSYRLLENQNILFVFNATVPDLRILKSVQNPNTKHFEAYCNALSAAYENTMHLAAYLNGYSEVAKHADSSLLAYWKNSKEKIQGDIRDKKLVWFESVANYLRSKETRKSPLVESITFCFLGANVFGWEKTEDLRKAAMLAALGGIVRGLKYYEGRKLNISIGFHVDRNSAAENCLRDFQKAGYLVEAGASVLQEIAQDGPKDWWHQKQLCDKMVPLLRKGMSEVIEMESVSKSKGSGKQGSVTTSTIPNRSVVPNPSLSNPIPIFPKPSSTASMATSTSVTSSFSSAKSSSISSSSVQPKRNWWSRNMARNTWTLGRVLKYSFAGLGLLGGYWLYRQNWESRIRRAGKR